MVRCITWQGMLGVLREALVLDNVYVSFDDNIKILLMPQKPAYFCKHSLEPSELLCQVTVHFSTKFHTISILFNMSHHVKLLLTTPWPPGLLSHPS